MCECGATCASVVKTGTLAQLYSTMENMLAKQLRDLYCVFYRKGTTWHEGYEAQRIIKWSTSIFFAFQFTVNLKLYPNILTTRMSTSHLWSFPVATIIWNLAHFGLHAWPPSPLPYYFTTLTLMNRHNKKYSNNISFIQHTLLTRFAWCLHQF